MIDWETFVKRHSRYNLKMVTTYHGLGVSGFQDSNAQHVWFKAATHLLQIRFDNRVHMMYAPGVCLPRPMTAVELGIAVSQANNWTSASGATVKLSMGARVNCRYKGAASSSRMYVVTVTAVSARGLTVKYSDGSVEHSVARGRIQQRRKGRQPLGRSTQKHQLSLKGKPLLNAVVVCAPIKCTLPAVSISADIQVCREVSKGWYLRARGDISTDIPRGKCVGMYPLTIKMQPAWAQAHHLQNEVAQQNNFLMPVYAKRDKTGGTYRVDQLVGDVSTMAPLHSNGVPCVGYLCNEATTRAAVNVEYVHSTEGKLEPGTERLYRLCTVRPVSAGTELLADYGSGFPRSWDGMYKRNVKK